MRNSVRCFLSPSRSDPRAVAIGAVTMYLLVGMVVLDYSATVALVKAKAVMPGVYLSTS